MDSASLRGRVPADAAVPSGQPAQVVVIVELLREQILASQLLHGMPGMNREMVGADVASSYPTELGHRLILEDGRRVRVRPIRDSKISMRG